MSLVSKLEHFICPDGLTGSNLRKSRETLFDNAEQIRLHGSNTPKDITDHNANALKRDKTFFPERTGQDDKDADNPDLNQPSWCWWVQEGQSPGAAISSQAVSPRNCIGLAQIVIAIEAGSTSFSRCWQENIGIKEVSLSCVTSWWWIVRFRFQFPLFPICYAFSPKVTVSCSTFDLTVAGAYGCFFDIPAVAN